MVSKSLIFIGCLILSGCFWNSEKDIAVDAVKEKFETELLNEARPTLEDKPIFHKRFVSIISGQTEVKVESASEINGIATIVINLKTISDFGRYNLKEVFAKQNEDRDTNFNGTEALSMILKMVKKESEKYALRKRLCCHVSQSG
ncbi:MAG: hypothetical protein B7Y39_16415 [Bdellovibrio sp. 28-41-41]|nr:MAG: hypothetical protein B7Y39_16415 [Bdellovibrio sp. 28-41-41]